MLDCPHACYVLSSAYGIDTLLALAQSQCQTAAEQVSDVSLPEAALAQARATLLSIKVPVKMKISRFSAYSSRLGPM